MRLLDATRVLGLLAWAALLGPGCLVDPVEPAVVVQDPCKGGTLELELPALGRSVGGLEPRDCVLLAELEDGEGATSVCSTTGLRSPPARMKGATETAGCARLVSLP